MARIFDRSDHVLFITKESSPITYTAPNPSTEEEIYKEITGSFEIPYPDPNRDRTHTVNDFGRQKDRKSDGQVDIGSGSITSKLYDGRVFAWALGSENYDSANDLHELRVKQENPPTTFSMQLLGRRGSDPDQNISVVGAVPDVTTVTIPQDGSAEAEVEWLATNVTDKTDPLNTSNVTSFKNKSGFKWVDRTKKLNFGGRTWGTIQEVEIEIDNGVETYHDWDDPTKLYEPLQPRRIAYTGTTFNMTITALVDEAGFVSRLANRSTEFDSNLVLEKDNGIKLDITGKDGIIETAPYEIPEDGNVETEVEIQFRDLQVDITNPNRSSGYL